MTFSIGKTYIQFKKPKNYAKWVMSFAAFHDLNNDALLTEMTILL
jgi:hypothetical protein